MFVAFNDNSCDLNSVSLVSKELVIETWNACISGNSDAWVKFENQWPGMVIVSEDSDQVQGWLKSLTETGKVSDTEENLCWAIAQTEQDALALLSEEIAKFS